MQAKCDLFAGASQEPGVQQETVLDEIKIKVHITRQSSNFQISVSTNKIVRLFSWIARVLPFWLPQRPATFPTRQLLKNRWLGKPQSVQTEHVAGAINLAVPGPFAAPVIPSHRSRLHPPSRRHPCTRPQMVPAKSAIMACIRQCSGYTAFHFGRETWKLPVSEGNSPGGKVFFSSKLVSGCKPSQKHDCTWSTNHPNNWGN